MRHTTSTMGAKVLQERGADGRPTVLSGGGGELPDAAAPRGIFTAGLWPLTVGGVLLVTLFAFEAMAVATAMPTVAAALDGLSLYGLAFGATFAASVVAMVVAGIVTDRRGPQPALWLGMIAFTAGLVVAGTATTMPMVVVGRAALGLGAGGQIVAVYVIVGRGYPPELHKRVFAAFAAAWILPAVAGPPIAGALVEYVHWRAVFLVAAVLVVPAAISMRIGLRSLPIAGTPRAEADPTAPRRVRAAVAAPSARRCCTSRRSGARPRRSPGCWSVWSRSASPSVTCSPPARCGSGRGCRR